MPMHADGAQAVVLQRALLNISHLRLWSSLVAPVQADVQANMWAGKPRDVSGLAALYTFTADTMYKEPGGKVRARSNGVLLMPGTLLCHHFNSICLAVTPAFAFSPCCQQAFYFVSCLAYQG